MTKRPTNDAARQRKLTIGNAIIVSWLLAATWFIPAQVQIWQNKVTMKANSEANAAAVKRLESPEGRLEVVAAIRTQFEEKAQKQIQTAVSQQWQLPMTKGVSGTMINLEPDAGGTTGVLPSAPLEVEINEHMNGLELNLEVLEQTVKKLNDYDS